MSEPIQSIAQNNYILSTQQEISHDNTLSGNGTVDSPLCVVPGYNETVLFEGTPTSVTSDVPLAENTSNFEYVDVFAKWNYNGSQYIYCFNRIPTNVDNFNLFGYGTYNNNSSTDYQLWIVVGDYVLSSTKISVLRAYRRTSDGSDGSNSDTIKIYKVVGINRKA